MWSDAARQAARIAEGAKAAAQGDHQPSEPVQPGRQPVTVHAQPSVGCPIIYDSGFRRVAPDSGNACEET